MEWLIIFSIFFSTLNFYFLFKKLSQKPFQQELEEFRSYSERIIVEFNRITTRNVELLDSRIAELDHKIRLSQKIDKHLSERFEEASKLEYLSNFIDSQKTTSIKEEEHPINNNTPIQDINNVETIDDSLGIDITVGDDIEMLEERQNDIVEDFSELNKRVVESSSESGLFEGIPIQKIKKHQKKTSLKNKQELLKSHIEQNKTKEELLALGFNNNEINLAMLCYSTEKQS